MCYSVIPRLHYLIVSSVMESIDHGAYTELDYHTNIVMVGDECIIFHNTGITCTVNAFTESSGKLEQVPIIDDDVSYDCLFQAKYYILLVRNAFHVPDIAVDLLPPFIIREAGLQINECPKIQLSDPTVEVHSMYSEEVGLRIHFGLSNTFSYLSTRKSTNHELASCDKLFITPDSTLGT